jgi:processive 1,2-diacylglycerol beta-glucosyltransferase
LKLYNAVIFQKHSSLSSLEILEAAKLSGVKTIYDIDDFLPAFPKYSGGQGISKKIESIKKHIVQADIVTTTSSLLKENIDNFFGVKSVLVPFGINLDRHRHHMKNRAKVNRFIFTNADQLKLSAFKKGFIETVNSFLAQHNDLELDVFSDPNPELTDFLSINNLGNLDWFEHKKYLAEQGYLFSVTPLGSIEDQDSLLFNSCKSPIKYLEYGGLEIPGIYSNSPIYTNVIQNRVTGLLVDNDRLNWRAALDEMQSNQELRIRISKNAFEDVYFNHNISQTSLFWLELLK